MNFFAELKRRNVLRAAAFYAASAWLLVQIATQVFPFFHIAEWVVRWIVVATAIGFPFAMVFSWFYEWTTHGLQRESEVAPNESLTRESGKKLDRWIIAILALAVVLLLTNQFVLHRDEKRDDIAPVAEISAKSIAVLPFDNLSRDPDNAYFAEGVQDEILTRLAKVADLKVIARTSTQRFKSAPENLPDIAKQLGALNILEGSVQKVNDQVRVNVQLINALTNAHLWAEIYDRKLTDIFAVESDIAKTIADTLQAKLTGSEKQMMAAQPTTDTTAYELYHKGRSLWEKRSGDNIPKAISFYEQAIAHDPNYALAYAGLADAYILLPYYTATAQRDVSGKAKDAALKALRLDPNLAEAHAAVGKVLNFAEIDLAGSIREFERAIELKPNYATAHHWLGAGPLVDLGRFDDAIAHGKRAIELDPLSPIMNADLGLTLYFARHYDDAVVQLRKPLVLD